jgi:hypothetical protein
MRTIGSRREESSTRRSVESTSGRPGSTGRKAEGGGRSTRGRGVRTGGVRRCVRYLAYPGGKARAHVASTRLPGSIRTSGIAEKPVGKPCRASPSSSMKNTPTGIDQDAGFRCIGREGLGADAACRTRRSGFRRLAAAVPAGEGIHRKARYIPVGQADVRTPSCRCRTRASCRRSPGAAARCSSPPCRAARESSARRCRS